MSQLTTQRLQSMSTPELQGIMEGEDANAKKFEDRFGFWYGMDKNDLEDMITEMREAYEDWKVSRTNCGRAAGLLIDRTLGTNLTK